MPFPSGQRLVLGLITAGLAICVARPGLAQTAVRFSIEWKYEGTHAPFLAALDRGYYKTEGLDVTIDSGVSSFEATRRVASGAYDMGFADINVVIKFRDQNPQIPIKTVFMVHNSPAFAIVARKSRGVMAPKDLEGKRLGAPVEDAAYALWPIFVSENHIDPSKVTILNVGFPAREPMLVSGNVDAVTALSFSSYINVKYSGISQDDIVLMLMSDYGIHLYGNGIIVNPDFAAKHPEAVKGFLRAYLKSLKETIGDPAAAIESVLKRNDVAKKEIELDRLKMALYDNILTAEVRANGFGSVDAARLDKAIAQIALTYPFKSPRPSAGDLFDPSFLPESSSRRMN
jgi:NitT/TauT family transport system substrate-binding protein